MFHEEIVRMQYELPPSGTPTLTAQFVYNFFIKHRMKGIENSVNKTKVLPSHVYAFLLTREDDDEYEIECLDYFILSKDGVYDYFMPVIMERITRHGNAYYNKEIDDYVTSFEYNQEKEVELANKVTGNRYYEFLYNKLHCFYDNYFNKKFEEIIDENIHKIEIW